MNVPAFRSAPVDPTSAEALAANGLDYRLVDTDDQADFDAWIQVDARGFLDGEMSDESLTSFRDSQGYRRHVGVYDSTALDPASPVATTNSWITELTLPGGSVPAWAISSVTVAPTHRRRGVARALLEGELRAAAALGTPMAMLTVSEATIYSRFGFAPAAFATDWIVKTARATWIAPVPDGRIDFISRERFRDEASALHERVRVGRPGEIAVWPGLWGRMARTAPGAENAKKARAIQYTDPSGAVRGLALYQLSDDSDDFSSHELELLYLLAETPDAYAAFWRFALEHDLVSTVKATLQSVDEPLRWMIADQRAATVTTGEHQWLRIIDVPAVLSARGYAAPGRFVLSVADYLGFAEGTWAVEIDGDGVATVMPSSDPADLSMTVNELSAVVLGGVRTATLVAAGRVSEATPDAAAALDVSLASPTVPYLSVWY